MQANAYSRSYFEWDPYNSSTHWRNRVQQKRLKTQTPVSYSLILSLIVSPKLLASKQVADAIEVVTSDCMEVCPCAGVGERITEYFPHLGAVLQFGIPQLCV